MGPGGGKTKVKDEISKKTKNVAEVIDNATEQFGNSVMAKTSPPEKVNC